MAYGISSASLQGNASKATEEQNSRMLMRAASHGNVQQVQRLLAEGAHVDHADELGSTALMQAAGANQLEVMHVLLDAGADVARRDHQGKTVIDIATAMGEHLLARALASRIVAPAATGNAASTAALAQPKSLPLSLLQAAEDQDLQGMEALMARLRLQKRDVAAALNQRGKLRDADSNVTAMESTPLLTAVGLGNASLVATLMQAGADPEQTGADGKDSKQGWTPMMRAVAKGDANLVKVLLGWTPVVNHVCRRLDRAYTCYPGRT